MSLYIFSAILIPFVLAQAKKEQCDVIPKDPIIRLGSSIQITFQAPPGGLCKNNTILLHDHKLIWTLNDVKIAEDIFSAHSTNYIVTINNFTHHKATVDCRVDVGGEHVVLGGTTVTALLPPGKATNISCITVVLQNTTCYWMSEQDTSTETWYTVKMSYTNLNGSFMTETCKTNSRLCTFEDNILPFTIQVTAHNAVGKVESEYVNIGVHQSVKIDLPQDITMDTLVRKLEVEWKRPYLTRHTDKIVNCEILYHDEEGLKTAKTEKAVMKIEENQKKLEIVVEKQCTSYFVSMRCAFKNGWWSDWSPPQVKRTPLDVNSVRFELWRVIKELDERGNRNVLLMWKAVPTSCSIDGYKITVTSIRSKNVTTHFCRPSESKTSIIVDKEEYVISIAGYIGSSAFSEDDIIIPAFGEVLSGENHSVVKNVQDFPEKDQLHVTWTGPRDPAHGYVVEWTVSNDELEWRKIHAAHILLKGVPYKLYRISVFPLYGNRPGHEFRHLAYYKEGDPGIVSNVSVLAVEDTSARVSWDPVPRNECCGFVVNYTVFYWSDTSPEPLRVTVNSNVKDIDLNNLKRNTKYTVRVVASSLAGQNSSDVMSFTTRFFYPHIFSMTLLYCALCIIFIGTICIFCIIVVNKYIMKVPSPEFSTVALWLHQHCEKDSLNGTFLMPASEDFLDKLEIRPYGLKASVNGIRPTPMPDIYTEHPGNKHDHLSNESRSPLLTTLAEAGAGTTTSGNLLDIERLFTGTEEGRESDKKPDSETPLIATQGKVECMGDIAKTVPFQEPQQNILKAYVSIDFFDLTQETSQCNHK